MLQRARMLFCVSAVAITTATAAIAQDSNAENDPSEPPGLDEYFALTPEMRKRVIQEAQKHKKATREALPAPKVEAPTTTMIDPNLPELPPTVNMNSGYTTTLVFRDITGQPWKIQDVFIDEKRYQQAVPDGSEHMLVLQPREDYVRGNVTILLADYDKPIPINLVFSDDQVRFNRTFQIKARGPAYVPPTMGSVTALKLTSPHMVDFLDNIPPSNAVPLRLQGRLAPGMTAWSYDGSLYVRTTYTVQSPAPIEFQNSGEVKVYRLPPIPVLLVNDEGETFQVRVTEEVAIGR